MDTAAVEGKTQTWPDAEAALTYVLGAHLRRSGPITGAVLARGLALAPWAIEAALAQVEMTGSALRGQFLAQPVTAAETESANTETSSPQWCDRFVLARIHRRMLEGLRKQIEPVSAADFLRFLFAWHGLLPGQKKHGPEGLASVVGQLQGFECAAGAWEAAVLPARLETYNPQDLDNLCLGGQLTWGRLENTNTHPTDPVSKVQRATHLSKAAPISLLHRDAMLELVPPLESRMISARTKLSTRALSILEALEKDGASFIDDLAARAGQLRSETESALLELISVGLVSGDGFAGLRGLLPSLATGTPQTARHRYDARLKKRGTFLGEPNLTKGTGRWSIWTSHRQSLAPKNVTQPSLVSCCEDTALCSEICWRANPTCRRGGNLSGHSDVWKCRGKLEAAVL